MATQDDFVLIGTDLAGFPKFPHEVTLGRMRLCLLPPGQLDMSFTAQRHFIDINLNGVAHDFAANSDTRKSVYVAPDTFCFGYAGTSFSIGVTNVLPGCYLELEDDLLRDWCETADLDLDAHPGFMHYAHDLIAAQLARAAIPLLITDARRHRAADRLTFEALGFAIAARAMGMLEHHITPGADVTANALRRADARRVARAIDWAEAHVCDPMLTVSDMAAAANLSPSHFAQIFKAAQGETAYQYILRRRAEFARDLIAGTTDPLAQIAYAVGFSSQAHMTCIFKRQFGVTPATLR